MNWNAAETFATAIRMLPRVHLAHTPTPLEWAPRLSETLGGPSIYIKRDDMTGLALGGNKSRMLEFVLAQALAEGADTVVAGAAVQSNYVRQMAAACAKLGLDCHVILRRIRDASDDVVQGSLLLDLIYGASVSIVSMTRDEHQAALRKLRDDLTTQGRQVYLALNGDARHRWLHSAAYAEATIELAHQIRQAGIDVGRIYVASLDATHAGILLGLKLLEADIELYAVTPNERSIFPDHSIEDEVASLVAEVADELGLEVDVTPSDVNVIDDEVGDGYGEMTDAGLEAIKLFGRTDAILLDPVYTSKAAAAMVADVSSGDYDIGRANVFWLTGGSPATFAYANEFGFSVQ